MGPSVIAGMAAAPLRYPQSALAPAGPVARSEFQLIQLSLVIMLGVFVAVTAAFAYTAVRYRSRPGNLAPASAVDENRRLEIGWTLVPLILLVVMAVPTVKDSYALTPPDTPRVVDVRVIGHQFWWELQYTRLGVTTANELVIPYGRKIDLSLTSADVIHSFWVPRLAGKTDLNPGQLNTAWIQADRPGVYEGQCAEYCGLGHANMHIRVVAVTDREFARWVDGMRHPRVTPASALAKRGMALFGQVGCSSCHTVAGTRFHGQLGPELTGMGNRATIAAGTLTNTPAHLRRWLANPPAILPGSTMPDLHLTGSQISALTAYVESLR